MSYYLDVEPIEAECPSCGTDLVCPDCDEDDIMDGVNEDIIEDREGSASLTLVTQLRALYDNAIDTGRLSDMDLLDTLIEEVK